MACAETKARHLFGFGQVILGVAFSLQKARNRKNGEDHGLSPCRQLAFFLRLVVLSKFNALACQNILTSKTNLSQVQRQLKWKNIWFFFKTLRWVVLQFMAQFLLSSLVGSCSGFVFPSSNKHCATMPCGFTSFCILALHFCLVRCSVLCVRLYFASLPVFQSSSHISSFRFKEVREQNKWSL